MIDATTKFDDLPEFLTTEEFAAHLRIGEDYVRRQCANGRINATNLRGKAGYRIPREEIRRFSGVGAPDAARPRPPRGRRQAR